MADAVIWGATGHARVVAECAGRHGIRIVAVVDRNPVPPPLRGLDVLVGADALRAWLATCETAPRIGYVAIGGGRGSDRRRVRAALNDLDIATPPLVHPLAHVADDAMIGTGSQVLIGATVGAAVRIGASVIVNSAASVDHDGVLEDGVHIGPGAVLAGEVSVGRDAFVGAGAVILPRLAIGAGAIVGAGAVVTRSVPAGATVVGNPARVR